MESSSHTYIAMDLKSFYASVECADRGLDPLNTNLVVADASRTQKTICLAVSPSLKAYGIPGRARLFEVISKIREVNALRKVRAPGGSFLGKSTFADELQEHPELEVSFITATPRMARYLEYSTQIYDIYLRYLAPEDIHVYSIDEVFLDVTQYLKIYKMTAEELATTIATEILKKKGLTVTAGIGTNLYLCKVAMDIVAKHIEPDSNGVRIAKLDEISYRELLWDHKPLTDFWRVGAGYRKKLEAAGMFTMGDIARCSIGGVGDYYNEGSTVWNVWNQRGTSDRSCLGIRTGDHGSDQILPPGDQLYQRRAGSALCYGFYTDEDRGSRDGRAAGTRPGGEETGDRPGCFDGGV